MKTKNILKTLFLVCTLSSYCILLAGCGQSGPLYLPTPKPNKTQHHGHH